MFVILGIVLGLLLFTLYAACVVSGRCSRQEERAALIKQGACKRKSAP